MNIQRGGRIALAIFLTAFLPADFTAGVYAAQTGGAERHVTARPGSAAQDPDKNLLLQAGQLYDRKKYDEARNMLLPLAQKGNADASFALGLMEARGDLGRPDYVKAREWWEKAAQKGHPEAEYNLGLIYYRGVQQGGDGTDPAKRDFAETLEWWNKAAEHGHITAMYSLAGMARTGEGQPKNMRLAASWYTRAAKLGHPEAQYQLGSMYLNGAGVEKNLAEAKTWMQQAAEAGHPGAVSAMKMLDNIK
ncbi:MAG: sel1 repeat family protein [Deltaproteobacteria bacterium]|nr:sel1 repeat family protein [Deltaproteobacteria bacterium]